MRLLVTGGAGYIGSVVASALIEAGHDVTVLDDLSTGHADAVPPGPGRAILSTFGMRCVSGECRSPYHFPPVSSCAPATLK